VVDALNASDPGRLIALEDTEVRNAAIDGLWQALMLAGVMNRVPMTGSVACYEISPTSTCGMLVASYEPVGN
jgi:aromatic ring-opening dioxygenase LigB subunit